jgi:hypothetical protein
VEAHPRPPVDGTKLFGTPIRYGETAWPWSRSSGIPRRNGSGRIRNAASTTTALSAAGKTSIHAASDVMRTEVGPSGAHADLHPKSANKCDRKTIGFVAEVTAKNALIVALAAVDLAVREHSKMPSDDNRWSELLYRLMERSL